MDSDPKQLRRAAADAFVEALDQLAVSLQPSTTPDSCGSVAGTKNRQNSGQALEDAAADIEQYLQQQAQSRCR